MSTIVSQRRQHKIIGDVTSEQASELEIETKEEEVKSYEERLDDIEKKIRVCDLSEAELKKLTEEEIQLKKKLKDSRKDLSGLRKENWKSSLISFAIFGLGIGFYYMVWGT